MGLKIQKLANQMPSQSWHVVSIKGDYVTIRGTMKQRELATNMFVQYASIWGGKIGTCLKTVKCPPGIQKTSDALPKGSAKLQ